MVRVVSGRVPLRAAAGGWLFGWLGDRVGRAGDVRGRDVLLLFTLVCYFTTDADAMLVLRFSRAWGSEACVAERGALVARRGRTRRGRCCGLLGAAANVGFVLLRRGGYCFPLRTTRGVDALVAASPVVLGVAILLLVPESRGWLAAQRKAGPAAESSLRECCGRRCCRERFWDHLGAIPVIGSAANANWLVPWTDHAVAQRAKAEESTEKPKKPDARTKAMTQITRSGGAVFGSLLGGVIASVLGRRWSYFLISLGAFAISSFIFSELDPLHPDFQLWTFALGFVGIAYFGWLPLFLPELFPTRVRATGTGISFNTGRVVAAIVVLSAGFLLDQFGGDYARVGYATGMIYVAGMVVVCAAKVRGKLED